MEEALVETLDRDTGGQRRTADILLIVTAFVVLGLAGAWFVSDRFAEQGAAPVAGPAPADIDEARADFSVTAAAGEEAEVNLRKGRMAADAGMLVEPAGQNALYFYSLILDAEPDHAAATAELAAVADEVAGRVRGLLAAGGYAEAARLASKLAGVTPGHPVIVEVQETLIAEQQRLVMEAVGAARSGNDGRAAERLAAAETLPQVDDALITTAREQIGAIRSERAEAARRARAAAAEREAAARAAAEQERTAAEEARESGDDAETGASPEPDPLSLARESLAAGRLIRPVDDNALGWLAAAEQARPDDPGQAEFRERLITAMSVAIRDDLDAGALEEAEQLLLRLGDVTGSAATAEALQQEVDRAFVRRESRRVIPGSEMLALEITPPVYPRGAVRRGLEGWVEVEFTVLADGSTADAQVTDASQERVFDRASLRAVQQWQFRPRVYRGRPIDQRVSTRISFTLEDD